MVDYFVLDLLSHPVFKTHELIWEFLVVPSIQNSVIASRTKLKRDSLLETIQDTYSPIVEAPTGSVEYFKDMHAQLSRLQVATRQAGNCVKRLGHHKKDMSQTMRILRFHLSRPTTEITFESPLIVSEALRQIGDIYMKQVCLHFN